MNKIQVLKSTPDDYHEGSKFTNLNIIEITTILINPKMFWLKITLFAA